MAPLGILVLNNDRTALFVWLALKRRYRTSRAQEIVVPIFMYSVAGK